MRLLKQRWCCCCTRKKVYWIGFHIWKEIWFWYKINIIHKWLSKGFHDDHLYHLPVLNWYKNGDILSLLPIYLKLIFISDIATISFWHKSKFYFNRFLYYFVLFSLIIPSKLYWCDNIFGVSVLKLIFIIEISKIIGHTQLTIASYIAKKNYCI